MKTFNFALLTILLPQQAKAGFIVQRPLYLGLDAGLVGYWSFDGQDIAGERAYDRSGNNTGTLTNGPVRQIGRIGQALDFDGDNPLDRRQAFAIFGLLTPPVQSFGFRRGFIFVTQL